MLQICGVVSNHLINSQVGVIDVIGGHFLPRMVSGWYHPMISSGGCVQVENKIEYKLVSFYNQDTIIDNRVEVVAIDGMWFCIRRELFDNGILFDENTFNSFHCYDLDICLQSIQNGYKNYVIDDVLIKHTSYGNFNLNWYQESIKLYDKWAKILPLYKGIAIDDKEIETRIKFVEQVMVWLYAYAKSQYELQNIRKSKAYKLGKFITKVINRFRL